MVRIPRLKYANFSEDKKQKARENNRLLFISPMTTKECQLRCPHCYTEAGDPLPNGLGLEDIKNIISKSKSFGAKTVRLAGLGEPFLDSAVYDPINDSFPIIDYANKLDMGVFIFTNGVLFNQRPELLDKLYEKEVTLLFKLVGDPETQERLTGNKEFFKRVNWENYNGLLVPKGLAYALKKGFNKVSFNKRGEPEVRVGIETCLFKENKHFLPTFLRWTRKNEIVPYFEQPFSGGRMRENLGLRVTDDEAFEISKSLARIDKEEFDNRFEPGLPYLLGNASVFGEARCDKRDYNVVVMPDGEVWACYGTPIRYGNIHKNTFEEIMDNPFRKQILGSNTCCSCHVSACSASAGKPIVSVSDLHEAAKKYDYDWPNKK